MTLRTAFQMDPIETITIAGDTTFALMLEAQSRGHAVFYYTPENLSVDGGKVRARGAWVRVRDRVGEHFEAGPLEEVDLSEFACVQLRQDPPFDLSYITTTYLLDRIHPKTLVVNDPTWVRNCPEKLFVLDYLDLMPPTLITRSLHDVRNFYEVHSDIIVKPIYGNGGAGVFRLRPGDSNLNALVELFQGAFREPFIVQQFRHEVSEGDKRILLVNGEVAGAINRRPAAGETRSNMHVGGTPEPVELTEREHEICDRLGSDLRRRGLILAGIDVIGGYLTEINVTSPTGVREVEKFGGNDIAKLVWDAVENKISTS